MDVRIRPAEARDRTLLMNLFNLYQNELGAYCEDFGSIDENGYFAAHTVDDILPFGDGVFPYIILTDGAPCGLIMVTDARYALPGCDWCFQELYLIRAARGRGIARAAASLAMNGRPGRWCLSVYRRNHPARAFWERLIAARGTECEARPGEDDMLDLTFTAKEASL